MLAQFLELLGLKYKIFTM